tara:strand:+ start:2543 stop:2980 length:438 start_codon:yes stop_codon:yes gene_type:complete
MFTLNIILGIVLAITFVVASWWGYKNKRQEQTNILIATELEALFVETKKMADKASVYVAPGPGANQSLDYNSPAMLGTLVSVIVHKLGDLRLTAQDFDIKMDDHVSVYVDMKTHDVILSTSGDLGAQDPLSQLVNFTDPDDKTFH